MTLYLDLDVLDGDGRRPDHVLRIENGRVQEIRPRAVGDKGQSLAGHAGRATISPGLIDLQVNGGGGCMLGDCETAADVCALARAHQSTGTLGLMPTLISDTPEVTERIIDLVYDAAATDPAILGLHLEGPHLALSGAHDPARLRPLEDTDVALYLAAADRLPKMIVTLAPEQVETRQIAALAEAGITVTLGHSNASFEAASTAFAAGATGATHLFNAMSGLHHRNPGLAGASLSKASWFGLIADGHHVHPSVLALAANARPEAVVLVSDAMSVAGTRLVDFELQGRKILRQNNRLTLGDGTLAGADLSLLEAVKTLRSATSWSFDTALACAFDTPHRVLHGRSNRLQTGASARLLWFDGEVLHATLTDGAWTAV